MPLEQVPRSWRRVTMVVPAVWLLLWLAFASATWVLSLRGVFTFAIFMTCGVGMLLGALPAITWYWSVLGPLAFAVPASAAGPRGRILAGVLVVMAVFTCAGAAAYAPLTSLVTYGLAVGDGASRARRPDHPVAHETIFVDFQEAVADAPGLAKQLVDEGGARQVTWRELGGPERTYGGQVPMDSLACELVVSVSKSARPTGLLHVVRTIEAFDSTGATVYRQETVKVRVRAPSLPYVPLRGLTSGGISWVELPPTPMGPVDLCPAWEALGIELSECTSGG